MQVVAKFKVINIDNDVVTMEAVTRDNENKDWSKWTPWGKLEMCISNESALEQFIEGKEYEILFNKVG